MSTLSAPPGFASSSLAASPVLEQPGGGMAALRDAVLDGRFVGTSHAANGRALAEFIAGTHPRPLSLWFGDRAAALAGDPERLRLALDRDIAAIDALLSAQVDAILHHERLRRLEGRWRGVAWLVDGIASGARIKVRLLNVSWPEIVRDLERAAEFDQSQLFHRVYEDEFGSPGGEPYGLILVDHELRHRPSAGAPTDDVGALKLLAAVAAAAFVPMVLSASPALLEVDRFADLATVADPAAPFRGPEFQRWRGLFAQEDIRFLAVVLPRVLARTPWRDDPLRGDPFRYNEYAPDADSRVWMSAGFAFAHTVTRAFANFNWPADVRGVETDRRAGGLVDGLPVEPFDTDGGHVWVRPPLEIMFTDRQERLLVDVGLMPLSALPFGEEAVFGAVRSLQAPVQYSGANTHIAAANARLSTQINSMLCVSRFAHFVKMLGREMVGSMRTGDEIERQLQDWLTNFVNSSVGGASDMRSRYPLVSAQVTVRERPGKPGVFACIIQLQPHFQLDDVTATFRLATDLAAPGRSS